MFTGALCLLQLRVYPSVHELSYLELDPSVYKHYFL